MQPTSLSRRLGQHVVREKEAHDLSRNPEFAAFQFLGYRTTAAAVELVAFCDADQLTEGDIVRRRDEFFELVRRLPHEYGLKPRGRNPNGLLGFVFAGKCSETLARFIARQTRISHAAGTGGVAVSWAIDVANRRIHTHDNPVSIFPPVIVAARAVYPGQDYLESLLPALDRQPDANPPERKPMDTALRHDAPATPSTYDVFISYAREDAPVAVSLAHELTVRGVRVWLDKTALRLGDSLRRSIDRGLAGSRFGLVLLSRNFFAKSWTQHELDGLFARETMEGRTLVLPLWHEIDEREIGKHSPMLADKYALKTSDGIPFIADRLTEMFDPPPTPDNDKPQHVRPPANGQRPARSGPVHILFLAANSRTTPLDLERELERIETNLRMGKERDRLELKQVWAGSFHRLMQAMLDDSPTIVHFSGHGQTEGIVLRDQEDGERLISGEALATLFEPFRDTMQCVVLNACWSETQAQAIRRHVPHVIGMRDRIPDATAIAFSTGFYKAVAAGKDVPFAFKMGIASAQAEGDGGDDLITLL